MFLVPNALGGNVTRLGALFAGPVLALVLWPRGRLLVLAVSLPLLYWQLVAPVRDLGKAAGDPATERAFFAPLLAELDRRPPVTRIQVPPTENRWEAAYVAPALSDRARLVCANSSRGLRPVHGLEPHRRCLP